MGSFFRLLPSSPFRPSSIFRESLGHSLSSGRPFCPFHPGLPRCPGFGATGGRQFPPLPIRERDDRALFPSSPGGSSPRTRGSPGPPPPSSGRPRRGGAAPAFVGGPNSSPSAPRVFALGTGTPQPPILAARSPMKTPVWVPSLVNKMYLDIALFILTLYIT
jgi:hypothetical protein